MKILVVEDDNSIRETIGLVLETYHYDVQLVDGADGAMSYLSKEWPDVMLLDLSLIGISGEELYEKIRQRFGATPRTIVLSAVQRGESRIAGLDVERFLAKPYTLDQLINAIEDIGRTQSTKSAHSAR